MTTTPLSKIPFLKCIFGLILLASFIKIAASGYLHSVYEYTEKAAKLALLVTITHVNGVEYKIPREYVLWGLGDVEDEFLVMAYLPDMKGLSNDQRHTQNAGEHEVSIHVADIKTTKSFQERLEAKKQKYGLYVYLGERYGLRHYRATKILPQESTLLVEDPDFRHELYMDADTDASTSLLIDCDGNKSHPLPGCVLYFVDDSLLYEINFRKAHLEEWQSIKEKSLHLMQGFRDKGEATPLPQ